MNSTLQALLDLQQVDREIFKVESEMERLPQELADREEALANQQSLLDEKRKFVFDLRNAAKEIEHHTSALRMRQRKLEHSSSSGKVDAAMLASYEHEIRNLKRTVSDAENDALKHLEQAEQAEAEAAEMAAALEEEKKVFEEFKGNVESELAAAQKELEDLQSRRAEVSADGIPLAQLETYKGLLKTREGEALAELMEGICQGCFVNIPRNKVVTLARGTELVQCPSCARILYAYA